MDDPRPPTTDLRQDDAVPYFLWDRNVTVGRLRQALRTPDDPQRIPLLRALLREARPDEVWQFVAPQDVLREWVAISPGLGRRREFWEWLLDSWRKLGLLP